MAVQSLDSEHKTFLVCLFLDIKSINSINITCNKQQAHV